MALTTMVVAGVFAVVQPAQGVFAIEPERADMQQRLRLAVETLTRDLSMAGSGLYLVPPTGSLMHAFPPLLPFRVDPGRVGDAMIATDVVTIVAVPTTAAQTTLAADLLPGVLTLQAVAEPGCTIGTLLCGFSAGVTVAIYDGAGNFDLFTVGSVADDVAQITLVARPAAARSTTYPSGSTIVEVHETTYSLKQDAASQTFQLMVADGPAGSDLPVLDHIVGLSFDYDAEPAPPLFKHGAASYGPSPPPAGTQTSAYPAGENCLFYRDPVGAEPLPRLSVLGAGTAPVPLPSALMSDGPWCPDETSTNRWDADLLRIRRVRVTVRVEAALASLRGPAGLLFANGGSATPSVRWAPDQQIRFTVSPRNLNVSRE
jgi:hypothetical protein